GQADEGFGFGEPELEERLGAAHAGGLEFEENRRVRRAGAEGQPVERIGDGFDVHAETAEDEVDTAAELLGFLDDEDALAGVQVCWAESRSSVCRAAASSLLSSSVNCRSSGPKALARGLSTFKVPMTSSLYFSGTVRELLVPLAPSRKCGSSVVSGQR